MSVLTRIMLGAKKSPDVVLAVVMAAILAAMIIPLPTWLLDAGIALNLAAAVTLLVAAVYAKDALKVASFPTLLLLTTLFRLALNVSSTRLALSEGHAGDIIQAFGEFVVQGEYVVGAVIFIILTVVQFLVVAKGAERVAEVSARFTLDAMPGKQMSIDADLRAGAIDQATARRRRRELERESQMFGSMDGAMKFVKGDVIAGLIIVVVNLVGGIAIGVLQNGMTASEAAATYALIAIGDGLVSQIPSLCIAVAAGLVVTRVASEAEDGSLGGEIGAQFFGHSKPLYVVGGLCLALALMPGMPHLIFVILAALIGSGAYLLGRPQKGAPGEATAKPATAESAAPAAQPGAPTPAASAAPSTPIGVSPVTLDLSEELTALVEADAGKFVKEELNLIRDRVFLELGVKVPGVRVRTHVRSLPAGAYVVSIDEVPCATGKVQPDALYALVPPQEIAFLEVPAEPAVDPSNGKAISRVPVEVRAKLEAAAVALRTPRQLIGEHLLCVLRKRAPDLLGVQEVQALLDGLEPQAPTLVKEALNKVPMPLLTDVLRKLVQEEVSVRNIRGILEALVSPTTEGDATALAEKCRQALHRYLSHKYAPTGPLYAYLADPEVEEVIRDGEKGMDPERVGSVLEGVRRIAGTGTAVVLTSPDVRRKLRKLLEGAFPQVAVLTYGELNPDLQIRPVGKLAMARR
ncbi:MAG: type III secretion system export apparatus subunit SctV [Myxococcaceae bacterium]|nr:type III secretion system export apparatus subunit SctV [Myxococcaceae bacterium]